MKRKHPNTIPMEEMTQDLLDKAYSCEMSKEQLLKMFSDCIEKKWMEEEEKFKKKVEVYLQKNQGNIESYEADFYDSRFGYEDARNIYSKFKMEFDLSQRYKFYLEIICAMYKLHRNMNYGIDITSLYALLNHNHLDIDFNNNEEYVKFLEMLQNRSEYKFDVSLNEEDKILTLSTCYKENDRVVLHAKLIKMEVRNGNN